LCLKEGLTVFRDQEFSSDMRSRPVKRISDVRALRAAQFVEDAGPLAHPVRPDTYREINNFYTATVYEKGAELVRMIQALVGEKNFRAGMDLYFARHDGEAATVEQFVQCFADASGYEMHQFMRWYSQAGTPEVTVSGRFDASRKAFILECAQAIPATPGQTSKEPMAIPLSIGLVGKDGRELALKAADGKSLDSRTIVLTEQMARFEFSGIGEGPVLSINRGFSAPINLRTDLDTDNLAFLAGRDSDPFNRWQALQTISMRLLTDNVAATRNRQPPRKDDRLVQAFAATIEDSTLEPAFVALALILPSEGDIAREIGKDIDPDAIFQARTALRVELGQRLGASLASAYERMTGGDRYSPDAASAGRRALRNVALDLLAARPNPAAIARADRQYRNADNMTDRMAALATLSLHDVPERKSALADFYNRYAGDALVVDKWFSLQAAIPHRDTLDQVRTLTNHPAFSLANPNRVRSLIGAFAQGNVTQFNRRDGAGYEFIADTVLALDQKNPQVSARLATAFRNWRTMEHGRQANAERALRRIRAASSLSRDLSDIVDRALAAP
jgi:aminopeptidase N